MIWILGGYMWLFIHRPFEVWLSLSGLHIERIYMLAAILYWAFVAEKHWISNRLNMAFAFFSIVVLAAWVTSPYTAQCAPAVEDFFKVAVFYVLVASTVRDERDLKRLVMMFLGVMSLYMLHSLREYHCGRVTSSMLTDRMVGVDQTYGDANNFAATIVVSLPLLYAVWPLFRTSLQRWAIVGYAGLALTCTLLTSSRMGFVGLCALIGLTILFSKRRWVILFTLAVVGPIVFFLLPADRQNRFLTIVDPSYGPQNAQDSAESRWQGWHDGVQFWRERPVFGVGPGGFGEARKAMGFAAKSAHNLYGQTIGELGSVGAVAFAAILLAFLGNLLALMAACRRRPDLWGAFPARVIVAVSIAVVLLLVMGLAGHFLFRYTWLWFGAFEVIALACLRQCELEGPLMECDAVLVVNEQPG
jgi:O-antigen ligase